MQRQRYEPWYTLEFNASLEQTQMELCSRARRIRRLCDVHDHHTCLDFGGGNGAQAAAVTKRAFVYDLSHVVPAKGVIALSDEEFLTRSFDVIVCVGVFEHLANPGTTLEALRNRLAPGGMVYIEVPTGITSRMMRLGQMLNLMVKRPRVFWQTLGPGALTVMHENINFLNPASMQVKVRKVGLRVREWGSSGNALWMVVSK